MEEKFGDLVIQEIHMLGRNVSKLDRKLDIKLDQVYREIKENKKCNEKAHTLINKKQDNHIQIHLDHATEHLECKDDCMEKTDTKVGHSLFRWILGGLITGASISIITMGALGLENQKKLERHIYFAEFIYHEVTGQKWNSGDRETLLKAREAFENHMEGIEAGEKLKFEK